MSYTGWAQGGKKDDQGEEGTEAERRKVRA